MLATSLTKRTRGAIVESPNKPTQGSGPRAYALPFLSVEYDGSCIQHGDETTLHNLKNCPNKGDHFRPFPFFRCVKLIY